MVVTPWAVEAELARTLRARADLSLRGGGWRRWCRTRDAGKKGAWTEAEFLAAMADLGFGSGPAAAAALRRVFARRATGPPARALLTALLGTPRADGDPPEAEVRRCPKTRRERVRELARLSAAEPAARGGPGATLPYEALAADLVDGDEAVGPARGLAPVARGAGWAAPEGAIARLRGRLGAAAGPTASSILQRCRAEDARGRGWVTRAQLRRALADAGAGVDAAEVGRIARGFDPDRRDRVSYGAGPRGVVGALRRVVPAVRRDALVEAFRSVARAADDRSGTVAREDLLAAFRAAAHPAVVRNVRSAESVAAAFAAAPQFGGGGPRVVVDMTAPDRRAPAFVSAPAAGDRPAFASMRNDCTRGWCEYACPIAPAALAAWTQGGLFLDVTYANGERGRDGRPKHDSRPLRVRINGRDVGTVCREATDGWDVFARVRHGPFSAAGLRGGAQNRVRFETGGLFPRVAGFAMVPARAQGRVSLEAFVDFFGELSASIDSDAYFRDVVQRMFPGGREGDASE
jgi:hypothetical protein